MSTTDRWDERNMPASRGTATRMPDRAPTAHSFPGTTGFSALALDVYETPDAFVIEAAVPGVAAADIEVTVEGDRVSLRAETRPQEGIEEGQYVLRERYYGQYVRSLTLPVDVDTDEATAEYTNGLLTLTVPKAQQERTRSVPVRAKS